MHNKQLFIYGLFTALISFIGCSTAEQRTAEINRLDYPDINAQEYIKQLKANTYTYYVLPKLRPDDIEFLMNYVADTTLIDSFPVNPISSYHGQDSYVGFIIMWTIENIQSNYPYHDNSIQNFPSQYPAPYDPKLAHRQYLKDITSLFEVSSYYHDWWKNNSAKPFTEYRNIDPLAASKYKW